MSPFVSTAKSFERNATAVDTPNLKKPESVPLTADLDSFVRRQLKHRPIPFLLIVHTLPAFFVVAWVSIPLNLFTDGPQISFWWFLFGYVMIYMFGASLLLLGAIQILDSRYPRTKTESVTNVAIFCLMAPLITIIVWLMPGNIPNMLFGSRLWWMAVIYMNAGLSATWTCWMRWDEFQSRAIERFTVRDVFAEVSREVTFGLKELGTTSFAYDEVKKLSDLGRLRELCWWCVSLVLAIVAFVAGQIYSEIYVATGPHQLFVEVSAVALFDFIVRSVTWIAGRIILQKTGRRDMPRVCYLYGQLTIYVFYRNVYSSHLASDYSVYVLTIGKIFFDVVWLLVVLSDRYRRLCCRGHIERIEQLSRSASSVAGKVENKSAKSDTVELEKGLSKTFVPRIPTVQDVFNCHNRDIYCDQVLKFLTQYCCTIAFPLWFSILRYGPNSFAYPLFQKDQLGEDQLPTLATNMSVVFAGELFSAITIWSIVRYRQKKDIFDCYVRVMITQPSLLYMVFVLQIHILSDLPFALVSLNKFV